MLVQSYQPHELRFAYCYRVYLRWQTLRSRACQQLTLLDSQTLNGLMDPYSIRVLECTADETDLLTLVSLQPSETISACASKLKGRVSKLLHKELRLEEPTHLLSRGYFARTVGKSTREAVEQYLETQAEHHGYSKRLLPPVFVERYELSSEDAARIKAQHANVVADFHLVMATKHRRGVFGSEEGRKIAGEWKKQQAQLRIAIRKVSFVPDHVHIAVRTHPATSPADLVSELMNTAQEAMQGTLIHAGLERLWEPSAYISSYGDFASPQIRKYLERLG
ncbi:MAG: IS200/IS605 family transposase [Pyrinomonadaceae bacterium]